MDYFVKTNSYIIITVEYTLHYFFAYLQLHYTNIQKPSRQNMSQIIYLYTECFKFDETQVIFASIKCTPKLHLFSS